MLTCPGVGGGFVGVDVFFVISGFLITGLLWREVSTTGTVRLRRFYGARARRLLPASATVGVVTVIASAVLLPPLQARSVIGDGIASALYVSNYRFALQGIDYFAASVPPSPFQHYWSLGVEEQFYLVWPPMIIGTAWLDPACASAHQAPMPRRRSARIWWSLRWSRPCRSRLSLVVTHVVPAVAFFSLPTRAWELAVGGLVALTADQWRRLPPLPAALAGWAGLGVILLACTRLSAATPYPGTAALLPVLGAALVIGAGCAAPARRGAAASWHCRRCEPSAGCRTRGICGTGRCWCSHRLLGHPLGLAGQVGSGPHLRRAGRAHPALHREPVAIRRARAPLGRRAVSRLAVPPPR